MPKTQIGIVVALAIMSLAALMYFGVETKIRFNAINESWYQYSDTSRRATDSLEALHEAFGYGGFIHDFKNYLLRGQPELKMRVQVHKENILKETNTLRRLFDSEEDLAALTSVEETLDRYMTNLNAISTEQIGSMTAREVDAIVRVDDRSALLALRYIRVRLQELSLQQTNQAQMSIQRANDFLSYGILFVAPITLAAIAFILIILRLRRTIVQMQFAQRSVESIIENAPDALITVDQKGHIAQANQEFFSLTGYSSSDLDTLKVDDLVPAAAKAQHPDHRVSFFSAPSRRSMTRDRRVDLVRKDGTPLPVEINLNVMPRHDGTSMAIANIRDKTPQLKTEEVLVQTRIAAESISAAKTDFIARMNHELRTPLNAVIGFSELIEHSQAGKSDYEYKEYIHNILIAGQQLRDLIDDIMDVSMIEANRLDIEIEDVDPLRIVQEAHAQIIPFATDNGIDVTLDALPPTMPEVRANEMRLKQVIANLLSNAIKYNKPGGSVHIGISQSKGERIKIYVEDTGLGIPKDQVSMIFDAFHRTKGNPFISSEGIGLGLTLSKSLTEKMNGKLTCESEISKGSTFSIELPKSQKLMSPQVGATPKLVTPTNDDYDIGTKQSNH